MYNGAAFTASGSRRCASPAGHCLKMHPLISWVSSLTRSRVGIFGIEEAQTLEQLEKLRDEDKISTVIIKPDTVFEKDRAVTVTAAGQRTRRRSVQAAQTLSSVL